MAPPSDQQTVEDEMVNGKSSPSTDSNNNDGNSNTSGTDSRSNNNNNNKMTATEAQIIEMLRRQGLDVTAANQGGGSSSSTDDQQQQAGVAAAQHLLTGGKSGDVDEDGGRKRHAFWDTQPMPTSTSPSSTEQHCPIIPNKEKSELRQEPYNMPKGFEWSEVDILKESERLEVYKLLMENYVEDDDCMFRFDYSTDFLTWALTPPGFSKAFHLGVRSSKSNRLMAFITGVPAQVRAYQSQKPMVEINFLCVHKKLRSKRLAPVLIKEITRRVNHTGVFQAVYTAGVVLPVPVASCRYYHRSLDPKKLVDIKFSRIPPRMTMARMQKLFKLPADPSTPGLRPMTQKDVPSAHKLLSKHLEQFKLAVVFSQEDFAHWLLPRPGVVTSYVACNSTTDPQEVTELCSFYHLPSTIIGHPKHTHLRAAYSFYNVATTVDLTSLMRDALIMAKRENQDVFNALSQMHNDSFLSELKFGIGDGNLQYYLYNWSCPTMDSKDVGIVLL